MPDETFFAFFRCWDDPLVIGFVSQVASLFLDCTTVYHGAKKDPLNFSYPLVSVSNDSIFLAFLPDGRVTKILHYSWRRCHFCETWVTRPPAFIITKGLCSWLGKKSLHVTATSRANGITKRGRDSLVLSALWPVLFRDPLGPAPPSPAVT